MSNTDNPPIVSGLSELAGAYRYLLCDVWGVVHDGVRAIPAADDALVQFREDGGVVVLITNAPRMKRQVIETLNQFGVDKIAYDDVVTSGEAAHAYLRDRPGLKVFHLGPERDLPIYAGLDLHLTGEDEAELVSCTGLFNDDVETPDDYAGHFDRWTKRNLPMLCVNPDKVVERGDKLIWCAGALADAFIAKGGETLIVGKPHAPIYETAMERFAVIAGPDIDRSKILAIGDGGETDLRGANNQGLDALFISGGIHVGAFGDRATPDRARIGAFLAQHGLGARAVVPRLVW